MDMPFFAPDDGHICVQEEQKDQLETEPTKDDAICAVLGFAHLLKHVRKAGTSTSGCWERPSSSLPLDSISCGADAKSTSAVAEASCIMSFVSL